MRIGWILGLVAGLIAGAGGALAQDFPTLRDARGLVFAERGETQWEIFPHEALSDLDLATLDQINQIQQQAYYAAMAIAPDEGLTAATTSLAANFHDAESASVAALAACDAARDGGADCVIVMVIRPEGWEAGRPLQLSSEATAALRSEYRRLPRRSRAMAISPGTGQWGVGEGREAAIAACGAADCRIAVEG